MPEAVYVGIAVCSHDPGMTAVAEFSDLSLEGETYGGQEPDNSMPDTSAP
jgi:hypothetical protein